MVAFPNKLQRPKLTEHENGRMRHAKMILKYTEVFYFSFAKSLA